MGKKKKGNPLQDALNAATGAAKSIVSSTGKGIGDVANTAVKTANDLGADDFVKANVDVLNEAKDKFQGGSVILAPFNKQEEAAKDTARADAAQREQAIRDQEQSQKDLVRSQAANASANRDSSIILGKRNKNKKGGNVSSGMGLSKGKTGLQT